jgi:hypothetical protein
VQDSVRTRLAQILGDRRPHITHISSNQYLHDSPFLAQVGCYARNRTINIEMLNSTTTRKAVKERAPYGAQINGRSTAAARGPSPELANSTVGGPPPSTHAPQHACPVLTPAAPLVPAQSRELEIAYHTKPLGGLRLSNGRLIAIRQTFALESKYLILNSPLLLLSLECGLPPIMI